MSSNHVNSFMGVARNLDAATEAESVQNAWEDNRALAVPRLSPSSVSETALPPTNESSFQPGTSQCKPNNLKDEDFGDFVTASTDPLKRPIYDTTENEDETQGLLNSFPAPVREADTYVGMGLVEPVIAGIGMFKRTVLPARNLATWKLNKSRAQMIIEEHKKRRLQKPVISATPTPAPSPTKKGATGVTTSSFGADYNQYLDTHSRDISASDLNGVMRPVSLTAPIDELMETERKAWGP
ncbi:uncharacterized protein J4E87_006556 [Alternaria ethzedia]|uniref:uncharacterized protein n=1 Tax=Alternaria ethzedia TaxID=181014 RepID=UPI0020C3AEAD|nr:uncharacterized protein J4E87_006556 [Alternaria ethzedia]KAI4621343.1 hypothetical protein J4E87_006556 [Alternaria ethzedia]